MKYPSRLIQLTVSGLASPSEHGIANDQASNMPDGACRQWRAGTGIIQLKLSNELVILYAEDISHMRIMKA